jgi:hypothetical protein
VYIVERQMAPDIAKVLSEGPEQLADDRLGLAAVRTFVVSVLDERHRGVMPAADVVPV